MNRYFGSKEKLFAEVIEEGFRVEAHLPEHLNDLGTYLAGQVLVDADKGKDNDNDGDGDGDGDTFDALRVLLRAAGNPAIAATVSERFHAEFVKPLAKLLRGRDAEMRAALIASYVIGLATMRHGLASPALSGATRRKAAAMAEVAIQACVG